MTTELPAALQWVLEVLVGERWPQADEDDVESAAAVWRHLGERVTDAHRAAEPAAAAVVEHNAGPAVAQFGQFWQDYSTHPIPLAVKVCADLEQTLREFAGDVGGTKSFILVQLELLAAEVALSMAGSGITLGVSDGVAAAGAAAPRAGVREALSELMTKAAATAAKMAVKASTTELINDGMLQSLQAADGGHSFDLRRWVGAGAAGAVGGLVGGTVGTHVAAIGGPSVVHSAIESGSEQLAENSADSLTRAAVAGQPSDPRELASLVGRNALLAGVHHASAHSHAPPAAHGSRAALATGLDLSPEQSGWPHP
jgi:hypothetical protein